MQEFGIGIMRVRHGRLCRNPEVQDWFTGIGSLSGRLCPSHTPPRKSWIARRLTHTCRPQLYAARVGILTPAQFFRSEAEDEPVLSRKGWKRPEYGAAAKSDSLLHHKLSCFQTPTLDARPLYLIGGEQR